MPTMTRKRVGYHNVSTQLPDVLWQRLCNDADDGGVSVARVLARIVARHYRVDAEQMPKPRRPGRPPKRP
jgi:hypothetical protein